MKSGPAKSFNRKIRVVIYSKKIESVLPMTAYIEISETENSSCRIPLPDWGFNCGCLRRLMEICISTKILSSIGNPDFFVEEIRIQQRQGIFFKKMISKEAVSVQDHTALA